MCTDYTSENCDYNFKIVKLLQNLVSLLFKMKMVLYSCRGKDFCVSWRKSNILKILPFPTTLMTGQRINITIAEPCKECNYTVNRA